jgi:MFS family permease
MWQSHSLPLFFGGYFFIGGYRLCRTMALAFARALVKPNEVGFAYGLVETGNAISAIAAPLVAGLLYNRDPRSIYIASLVAIGMMLLVNLARFRRQHLSDLQTGIETPQTGRLPVELPEQ